MEGRINSAIFRKEGSCPLKPSEGRSEFDQCRKKSEGRRIVEGF